MQDNQLIAFVAAQMDAASAAAGWNYAVVQKNQPTEQGVSSAPTIFFEKLFDEKYGWPGTCLVYNETTKQYDETETQLYATTFQISAWVRQDPNNLALPTASDVANYVARYIASRHVAFIFQQSQLGILRVSQVRNPYFKDDSDRYEANPNFDFVITHANPVVFEVPAATTFKENLVQPVA